MTCRASSRLPVTLGVDANARIVAREIGQLTPDELRGLLNEHPRRKRGARRIHPYSQVRLLWRLVVYLVASMRWRPDVPEILYAVAVLVCPVAMGAMMWVMMRGNKDRPAVPDPREGELARMRAEIDQLRAAQHNRVDGTHTR